MARLSKDINRTKPWKAEIRVWGEPWFLGYRATKAEATALEAEVRQRHPDARKEKR